MKAFILFTITLSWTLVEGSDLKDFTISSRQFSEDIYSKLIADTKENLIVSPFSAEIILALVQSGAVGTATKEIKSTLHLPESEEETEALIKSAFPSFDSEDYIVKTANKIYVENHLELKEEFKSLATDVYQAGFQNVNFWENVEAAEIINSWVEEQTNNKIRNLISPEDFDESTRLVLVNALYFEANWSVPFETYLSKKAAFYAVDNKRIMTNFMYRRMGQFNFYENDELDAKFVELPFEGSDASMTIIVPNKPKGIAALEKNTPRLFDSPKYQKETLSVALPKFKIEITTDFKSILEQLGVQAAFDSATADFSGIAGAPGELVISKIKQKAFIDVNEVGVTAAATTNVGFITTSALLPQNHVIVADHPFMFYIKVNDVILFERRVMEPPYE